ncbi:GNAT family N-acetyltransferase [Paenibacillus puldeungensis]|uniref:GNAT family N-acetyltransferase n=1 Tax=Paenibacillus puldeungensis TaxID=696536 RepID=A0ABW3RZL5_9BACL
MIKLETALLVLRNFAQEDWRPLQEMIVQYMSSSYAIYDHPWPTSDEEIQKVCSWFAGEDQYLAVCLKEDGRFIGYVCLNPTDDAGVYNIGYCFNFNEHGKGYAFEACRAMVTHAFHELNAVQIVTGTAVDNHPSCKLLHRLGMNIVLESSGFFYKDEKGNPIEFTGYQFELTREAAFRTDIYAIK